jgi:hypothetical protein
LYSIATNINPIGKEGTQDKWWCGQRENKNSLRNMELNIGTLAVDTTGDIIEYLG